MESLPTLETRRSSPTSCEIIRELSNNSTVAELISGKRSRKKSDFGGRLSHLYGSAFHFSEVRASRLRARR